LWWTRTFRKSWERRKIVAAKGSTTSGSCRVKNRRSTARSGNRLKTRVDSLGTSGTASDVAATAAGTEAVRLPTARNSPGPVELKPVGERPEDQGAAAEGIKRPAVVRKRGPGPCRTRPDICQAFSPSQQLFESQLNEVKRTAAKERRPCRSLDAGSRIGSPALVANMNTGRAELRNSSGLGRKASQSKDRRVEPPRSPCWPIKETIWRERSNATKGSSSSTAARRSEVEQTKSRARSAAEDTGTQSQKKQSRLQIEIDHAQTACALAQPRSLAALTGHPRYTPPGTFSRRIQLTVLAWLAALALAGSRPCVVGCARPSRQLPR